EEPRKLLTFRIFAKHAAAELVRLRLERQLRESEERLRDLYEEAPIAYVQEDLESRFISANRAAQRILGIKPEEGRGIVGLAPGPTPSAPPASSFHCNSEAWRPEASSSSCAAKTTANRSGSRSGRSRTPAANTRALCFWTLPTVSSWNRRRPASPPKTFISRKR